MIDKIEQLAEILIPYRKWMLVIFLIAFIGVMPTAFFLAKLFKQFWIFPIGIFLSFLGFTWSSGLFLVSYWYNPEGGPLTIKKINASHPLLKLHRYHMRYYAPVGLIVMLLIPFIILAMCLSSILSRFINHIYG